jgi:hypothetical protein
MITGIVVLVFGIIGYIVTDDFIRENRLPVVIGQFGCQSDLGEIARLFSSDINQTCQNLGFLVGLVSASLIICPILMVIGPIMAIVGCYKF